MFSELSKAEFLKDYWQQKSYVFRQAMNDLVDMIDGDELAGIACENDGEARIIQGRDEHGHWTCQQGPFDENDFAQLPEQSWTLLVQGLDQWFEEVQAILARFDFLPRWRLEDIMASYAPVGGGVGPHFDYYDVFLIQISGSRQWQLGQACDDKSPLQNNQQVKLLERFETEQTHELMPGDMLYVPAGKAHWGVASSDDCITFSVGFRAPSEKELISHMLECLADELSDQHRYTDSLDAIDDDSAKINLSAQAQVQQLIAKFTPELMARAAEQAFGELVTEPRYSAVDDGLDEPLDQSFDQLFDQAIQTQPKLVFELPPHTRLAYDSDHLYVNGLRYTVDEVVSRSLCSGYLACDLINTSVRSLLETLLAQGDILLSNNSL